tara:strand:- start:359 stop:460 length:102 start_codon:yes stop_codon:yes gene_type:complete
MPMKLPKINKEAIFYLATVKIEVLFVFFIFDEF